MRRINVNSALTFTCKENNEIFIFRKEEVFKVFIHESFHAFGLDFSVMDQKIANNIIKRTFQMIDYRIDLRIYESYCESWAIIINILFMNLKSKNKFRKINECLFYEKCWSLFQCSKVLKHYNICYSDLFKLSKNPYTEIETHPFSYYILKAINIFNINDFLSFCDKKNVFLIDFSDYEKDVNEYCEFLVNHSKTIEFVQGLKIIDNWFENGNLTENEIIPLKSMRMSFYG
jgi:hypothetical protein